MSAADQDFVRVLTSWLMATDPGGPAGDGRRAGGKSNLTAARP
jgi:hypothetical protein